MCSRAADRRESSAARITVLRVIGVIFLACYGLTLIIHWAHRDDWARAHTLVIAVPGALILFGIAGIIPAALFALLGFRPRFSRPLGALWLALAAALTVVAATARI
jgi:hypothetical protein